MKVIKTYTITEEVELPEDTKSFNDLHDKLNSERGKEDADGKVLLDWRAEF